MPICGVSRMRLGPHGVIFDLDGVIVDSHPAHRLAWRAFLRSLGKDVTNRQLDFVMDGRKRKDILVHFLGPLTDAELEKYSKLKEETFTIAASDVPVVPGVLDFMELIRQAGIPIAVATSAGAGRTRSLLHRLGLEEHLSAVVTGDDVQRGKPDPEIYHLACRRLRCDPSSAVAFEDASAGVRAAKTAGLRCVGIADNSRAGLLTSSGADYVVKNFVNLTVGDLLSLTVSGPLRAQKSASPLAKA